MLSLKLFHHELQSLTAKRQDSDTEIHQAILWNYHIQLQDWG